MIARILFSAFVALCCAGCGTAVPGPTAPTVEDQPNSAVAAAREETRDLTAAEKTILADGFTAGLDNADSVKFRWSRIPTPLAGHSFDYCGLINLKTRTGYTGMRPFLATVITENGSITGGAIAALNSASPDENRDVISKLCQQKGLNPFVAK